MATKKAEIQLQLSAREDKAGMAGAGASSEIRRKGMGPRPIEKDAWGQWGLFLPLLARLFQD